MGAREVGPNDGPEARKLHAIIERLCIQANLPKPRVAIAQTMMPNAFAIGRSPKKATVCATLGILDLLDPAELEAVIGHELTHVQNRDVMVMTIASFFASIAAFITQWGFLFGGGFGDRDNRDNNNGFIFVILISAAVYVISFLLLQALSRYREFAADRGSAIITGRPSALISALTKIDRGMAHIPTRDLRAAPSELAAFYIFPPKAKQTVATLFSTHPPLEARIARLQRLEAQLQGTA
jgi:heat shock protein HtpX